jgi:hypothetical protein
MTDLDQQDSLNEKPGMEETVTKGVIGGEGGTNNKDDQAVRQSERIKNHGLGGPKLQTRQACWPRRKIWKVTTFILRTLLQF